MQISNSLMPGRRMVAASPLIVAVPDLSTYGGHSGIGRVFRSLCQHWGDQVRLVDATFASYKLPVLRNMPYGVRSPAEAEVILLPKLTGAQAMRNTQGRPSVVIVHDIGVIDFPGDRAGMDWLTYRTVMQSFQGLRHATHIVTVSNFTRARLLHHLPSLAERVSVIPNGVDAVFLNHHRTRNQSRQRVERWLGRSLRGPIVLNVGSEAPRKQLPLLLDVFRRIKNEHPQALLLKVGSPDMPDWRAATVRAAERLELRVGTDFQFLEQLDDSTLADVYAAADVFVSTSQYEGFGLPALEALAVGTPVVVTTCGALAEVVGDAGWVVAPTVEPLVEAVHAAITDPRRENRVQRGRARAHALTWAQTAAHYLDRMHAICHLPRRSYGYV